MDERPEIGIQFALSEVAVAIIDGFEFAAVDGDDFPTSHQGMQDIKGDEFTGRMLGAINSMLVEMMAAIARQDYEQRRERQAQGIEKAKVAGKYQGRPIDEDLHKRVKELLQAGLGIRATARHANCSTTVLKILDLKMIANC